MASIDRWPLVLHNRSSASSKGFSLALLPSTWASKTRVRRIPPVACIPLPGELNTTLQHRVLVGGQVVERPCLPRVWRITDDEWHVYIESVPIDNWLRGRDLVYRGRTNSLCLSPSLSLDGKQKRMGAWLSVMQWHSMIYCTYSGVRVVFVVVITVLLNAQGSFESKLIYKRYNWFNFC